MASSPPTSTASSGAGSGGGGKEESKRAASFMKNAMKRKHSFIRFFAMTGILLLSVRSLGQKYRIHDLEEDIFALKEEHQSLSDRMNRIKSSLLHEASLDSTGVFGSRLRGLFADDD